MRDTAALIRIFGDISDTHNDCCCTAAAIAPDTLRKGLLPPIRTKQQRRTKTKNTAISYGRFFKTEFEENLGLLNQTIIFQIAT